MDEPSPQPFPGMPGDGERDTQLRRNRAGAVVITIAFFLALAPTLPWQEFSSGPENLVVATAMEMRRGAPRLVPTLQGETRVAKPPLAAWITAAAIVPQTMRDIDILDRDVRERGFFFLAIETRWPALLSACLLLLGVFELGRVLRDSGMGLTAIAICGSTYFLMRFARYTTTDIQLALWVTWGNVFLARAIVRGKWWSGCIGAAIALGLAMLSKGPVSLVQSVLPCAVYAVMARRLVPASSRGAGPREGAGAKRRAIPMVIGCIVFALAGFWWYALVLSQNANVIHRWFSEVTRIGATETPSSSIFAYLAIIAYVVPWIVFFIVGVIVVGRQLRRRRVTADTLALFLLVIPLLVMTLAKDRQDRYTLPMIPAASILAAIGVREYLKRWHTPDTAGRAIAALHWITLGAIAIVLPLLGATSLLKRSDGTPWFAGRFAAIEAALGAGLLIAGILLHRRRPGALVAMTFITMLVMQAVLFKGYCTSTAGKSDLKPFADLIVARYPDATFYNAHPRGKRPPTDLGVYLNRTIRWTADASQLRADTHPVVLFMLQNKGDSDPVAPGDFHFVQRWPRDKDWWWAFVLAPE